MFSPCLCGFSLGTQFPPTSQKCAHESLHCPSGYGGMMHPEMEGHPVQVGPVLHSEQLG